MILGEIKFVVIFPYKYESAVQCYASTGCVALRKILLRFLEGVWESLSEDVYVFKMSLKRLELDVLNFAELHSKVTLQKSVK